MRTYIPRGARDRFESVATPANTKATRLGGFCVGWGSRIRTYECQSQSLVPYRLAIPQYGRILPSSFQRSYYITTFLLCQELFFFFQEESLKKTWIFFDRS